MDELIPGVVVVVIIGVVVITGLDIKVVPGTLMVYTVVTGILEVVIVV